jgi:UDP-N-acetylglucosamine--dolichyl-phosphate N-acetylglucosaminephosphotransferase
MPNTTQIIRAAEKELFPKVPDYHKPDKPLVINGLGVVYVLASVTYLFLLDYLDKGLLAENGVSPGLTLATCILFGGFMGLVDDWMDLRWRYKALFPLLAALPLAALRQGTPTMSTYFWGKIDFSAYGVAGQAVFYFVMIPVIVTITTNTINQLGGLNGLETVCPSIVLFSLLLGGSPGLQILLYVPLVVYAILAFFNVQGKLFVGNTGSFAIGLTIASFALISNMEQTLVISILPYIFNSSLILLTVFLSRRKASMQFDGKRLTSENRRSLVTLITYHHPFTERQIVLLVSLLLVLSTSLALMVEFIMH